MKKYFLQLVLFAAFITPTFAQWTVRNVIYTTGGNYGAASNWVHTYAYAPDTKLIVTVDSAAGDFTNAVLSENQYVYSHIGRGSLNPAGSDVIHKYSFLTGSRIDSATNVSGLQRMAIHNNYLIATFGFGASSGFVRIFNKNSLGIGPIFTDTNIPVNTDGIAVIQDTLYVSYTLNDTAHLGVFSLSGTTPAYVTSIVLDSLSAGLGELFVSGNFIYGINEYTDWTTTPPSILTAGVVRYNTLNGAYSFAPTPRAYNGIGLVGNSLYANFSNGPGLFDVVGNTLSVNPAFPLDYSGAEIDTLNYYGYFMTTDYFSTGKMYIIDQSGLILDSVNTNISGGPIAFQYNGLPVATNGTGNTPLNTPFLYNMSLISGDSDGGTVSYSLGSNPSNGSAVFTANTLTYTPDSGFIGTDGFNYLVTDIWGDTISAYFTIHVGTTSNEKEWTTSKFNLYPNPSSDYITILSESSAAIQLSISDISGKICMSEKTEPNQKIFIGALAPGIYFIRNENESTGIRFIKN